MNCPKCQENNSVIGSYSFGPPKPDSESIQWFYRNCRACGYTTESFETAQQANSAWDDSSE